MASILTVTMNPAVDISTSVDIVQPARKLRCAPSRRDPGGGGVNVARVAFRLGAEVAAIFPAGGVNGQMLRGLIADEKIRSLAIPIGQETREDFTVIETSTGAEFRFVTGGPELSEAEWRECLETVVTFREPVDYLVASGSLPRGAPEDFYARLAALAKRRSLPFALDASGPALREALAHGVDLVKPSIHEMRDLTGEALADPKSCLDACRTLTGRAQAKMVALTLGSQGAILATQDQAWRAWPLPIKAVSTVGAGDSFLAAMVCALASGHPPEEAFRHGVAAGSAALITAGTQLCHPADMQELLGHVVVDRVG